MKLFQAEKITKSFLDGTREISVLRGIELTVAAGEMIAVIGASGSGKTTLLQVCGTLAEPTSGTLLFKGEDLQAMNNRQLADFRNRELGFIFQFHHLLPEFTAIENVMMPALIAGNRREEMQLPAARLLERVELDHRSEHRVAELSGGEQQRTALARALIMEPRLLLADEPTGNLDSRSGRIVFTLLRELCRERDLAVIMVTHNMELANQMDTVHTLKDGILVAD